jgi:hypothetical protein
LNDRLTAFISGALSKDTNPCNTIKPTAGKPRQNYVRLAENNTALTPIFLEGEMSGEADIRRFRIARQEEAPDNA